MAQTTAVTIGVTNATGTTTVPAGQELFVQTTAKDATGSPTGAQVLLSSSNTGVAKVTTCEQEGAAPAAVIGVASGTATITATASDNSAVTATLTVTVQ
ncbi:MAG: hypothetical protein JWM41_2886 [Gemmatimonadetes bacterium]|nr:hypothetical protein [Gemmatimonadota bacterium]